MRDLNPERIHVQQRRQKFVSISHFRKLSYFFSLRVLAVHMPHRSEGFAFITA